MLTRDSKFFNALKFYKEWKINLIISVYLQVVIKQ